MKLPLPTLAIGTAALVLVLLAAAYFITGSGQNTSPIDAEMSDAHSKPIQQIPDPVVEDDFKPFPTMDDSADAMPPPVTDVAESNLVEMPEDLADSDAPVLEAVKQLSPTLTQWLIPSEQVRKWVLTVDMMADGKLPKRYLPIDYAMDKFAVEKQGASTVSSDQNYARMTPLIHALASIDPKLLSDYYIAWKPLLKKAFQEQGKPGSFDDRMITALDQIIAVKPLAQKQALIRPSVLYRYENDTLEQATDIEKLCWRIGEENTQALQDFARHLRDALTEI